MSAAPRSDTGELCQFTQLQQGRILYNLFASETDVFAFRLPMLDLSRLADAVRYEGGISRRLLLAYGAALAAMPALSLRAEDGAKRTPRFKANPFSLGVASGDPDPDSVVL